MTLFRKDKTKLAPWHLRKLVLNARRAAQPPPTHRQAPGAAGDFFPPLAAAPQNTNHANTPYRPFSAEPRRKIFCVLTPRLGGERNPLVSAGHALRSGPLLCQDQIGGQGGRVSPALPPFWRLTRVYVAGRCIGGPLRPAASCFPGYITGIALQQLAGEIFRNTPLVN